MKQAVRVGERPVGCPSESGFENLLIIRRRGMLRGMPVLIRSRAHCWTGCPPVTRSGWQPESFSRNQEYGQERFLELSCVIVEMRARGLLLWSGCARTAACYTRLDLASLMVYRISSFGARFVPAR
jgi:hypothetical protein